MIQRKRLCDLSKNIEYGILYSFMILQTNITNKYMSALATTSIDDLPDVGSQNVSLQTSELPVQPQFSSSVKIQEPQNNVSNVKVNTPISTSYQNTQSQQQGQVQLSDKTINQIVRGIQLASSNNLTQLPSRDIPMEQSTITTDEQVKPNFVPKIEDNIAPDYINEFDKQQELTKLQNIRSDSTNTALDEIYETVQTPILVAILFFIFQMPIINKSLRKYIPSLFTPERSLSIGGYLFKASLFGGVYYLVQKIMKYASEI